MSDLITIPRSEWRHISDMLQHYKMFQVASELIGEEETCKLMGGISKKTLSNYIGKGDITVVSIGPKGEKFFNRFEIMGLDKNKN